MVPRTILTRSGPIFVNAVRPVNTIQPRTAVNNARPMKNVINNAYSTARRPFNKKTAANNSNFTKKVNTIKGTRVNTTRPKTVISAVKGNKGNAVKALAYYKEIDGGFVAFWRVKSQRRENTGNVNAARPVNTVQSRTAVNTVKGTRVNTARPKATISAVKGNKGNVVKASACWVWRPKHKVLDHVSRNNGGSMSFKRFDYIDAQGRYHYIMKKLINDLLPLEVILMEGKLLGKNSVLFTDTECVVLSPDFKLTDESHVLLKVPRKDNMYSVDLKNIVHLSLCKSHTR
ncbi:hypothetical protein Tco_0419203 [Tanacetum coccineum]